jgi:hypothetical protein
MSVDLIAGVLKAANAERRHLAELELKPGADSRELRASRFKAVAATVKSAGSPDLRENDLIANVMAAASPQKQRATEMALAALSSDQAPDRGPEPTKPTDRQKTMQSFEKMLMTQVVDQMLPKPGEHALYGDGTAGEVWRGFQAEQLADAVADRGILKLEPAEEQPQANASSSLVISGGWPFLATKRISSFAA